MMLMVLSGAAGIVLALLRFPVFSLVPIVVFFGAGAAGKGIVVGAPIETITLEVIGSIAAPQFAYLGVSLAVEFIGPSRWASHVRAAIGLHLGAERFWPFGSPRRRH
jgi:hypothetical protein